MTAFAFTKERKQLEKVFGLCRELGAVSILVTDLLVSSTAELADISLFTCRGDLNEFHSMVSPVALIDALTLAIFRHDQEANAGRLSALQSIKSKLRAGGPGPL